MKSVRRLWRTVFCLAALLLAGCAATVQYPAFPDQAKRVDDPNKARIYLIRKEKFVGSAVGLRFFGSDPDIATGPSVGGSSRMRLIGEIGPASYICWEEAPEPFKFMTAEGDPGSVFTINLQPGSVYYLRAYIHTGWTRATARIEVIDEKEALKLLKYCQPPNEYRKK